MKKKFTHLISCCFALLLLGSGTVLGQIWTEWDGEACHDMVWTVPPCNIVNMDGTASMTFYRWSSNPLAVHSWTSGTATNCSGHTTEWQRRLVYDDSSNPAAWHYETRSRTRSCNYDNPGYSWGGWSNWSNWTTTASVSFPNTSSTSYYEGRYWSSGAWHYGHPPHNHTTGTYSNLIFNLPSVVTSVNFISPNWTHYFVDYTISWSGNTPSYTSSTTSSSGNLPYGTMNSNGSEIRFTGSADQIAETGGTLTTATLSLPNKIWFDQLWDGTYNGVTITGWNPVTQGVQNGETLGFWHGYNGSDITINNGTLLLGEDTSCPDQKFSITSSSLVTIDAYNTNGAPTGCVTMPTVVTYNPVSGSQPAVAGSTLHITNTNGGCNPVNFCSFFNPTFSGNGLLLIDPNVTNFQAGATFTTAKTGDIRIHSSEITTTGDFLYTASSGRSSGNLDIFIRNPQGSPCTSCGFFHVTNDFTTNMADATGGRILIADSLASAASGHVLIGNNLSHTGSTGADLTYKMDVDNHITVAKATTFNANRDDIELLSNKSYMKFGSGTSDKFAYTGGSASNTVASDLLVHAYGLPCTPNGCGFTGGYIWSMGDITTTNQSVGTTTIRSERHYIQMDNGFSHTGIDGDMLVDGETRVDVLGSTGTPAAGVGIKRDGVGNDKIVSGSGHILIEDKLTYTQSISAPAASGLTVLAEGVCNAMECSTPVHGYVWIHDAVATTNKGKGTTLIKSENHFIEMDNSFTHSGNEGDLIVDGETGIDILGQNTSANGVQVTMDSIGSASFLSESGHIHVQKPFVYDQTSNKQDNNTGLLVHASGLCSWLDCINRPGYGYVWFEDNVTTKNDEYGITSIYSDNNYVLMDKDFTHKGVEGNLTVEADGTCDTSCVNANTTLPAYGGGTYVTTSQTMTWQSVSQPVDFSHPQRGYVRVGGNTSIVMDSVGDAKIISDADIVQFDGTFDYLGKVGSDLLVQGELGIRSIGNSITENMEYVNAANQGVDGNYGGSATFYSPSGFVDFHGTYTHNAHTQNNTIARETGYMGAGGSALDIHGHSRVRFYSPFTVTMDSTYGHAKIWADNGFVDFQNTLTFDGTANATHNGSNTTSGSHSTPGDLLIFADGNWIQGRACNTLNNCAPWAGVVLFQNDVNISFADTGRTLIKSKFDDIEIYTNFNYLNDNAMTAGVKNENGQFWMQAGQDIYGKQLGDVISFTQAGEKSIVMEAQGTIRTQQYLTFDRANAKAGSILLKAGYDYVADPFNTNAQDPRSLGNWTGAWAKNSANPSWCSPKNYTEREGGCSPNVTTGGDIWFEGSVNIDLSQTADATAADSVINTMIGALHSVYVDSSFVYDQAQINYTDGVDYITGDLDIFAHEGNIEAIKDGQNPIGAKGNPNTSVDITIDQPFNTTEIRMQAGNDPLNRDWCNVMNCYDRDQWTGNILFNKPLNITSNAKGYTVLSAERDIETQVDAPFTFIYTNTTDSLDDFNMTAGRHIETHKKMTYTYTTNQNTLANVTMEAGRLDPSASLNSNACTDALCKANEEGSNLYPGGNVYEPHNTFVNDFSKDGKGQGSILVFDSLEFNYDGKGTILMVAENGNIESDPYLHQQDAARGNTGNGYQPSIHDGALRHDAQITFNHSGVGITQMKAIDIKLHDKLAYYTIQHANDSNGQFYMTAYDSILTRNIEYVNATDTGSVFITTAKYKAVAGGCDNQPYDCLNSYGPGAIQQGHIVLGYGADKNKVDDELNKNDSIVFNFAGNANTLGANVYIRAGYEGFAKNRLKGKANSGLFNTSADRGKGYGGNITFDFMKLDMAKGHHTAGGYLEISTPNGNIWGKDSMYYHGFDGDILVDAGLGSHDDAHAIRWDGFSCPGGSEKTLNTQVPYTCDAPGEWRTGNIMMKGAYLSFQDGEGNATFRTREGFIDTYDAFTVDSMRGHLLKYAGTNDAKQDNNQWGDVSERDFQYTPIENSGSVFFGADDNIMMNYGYSNDAPRTAGVDGYLYEGRGEYEIRGTYAGTPLVDRPNPYYSTAYMPEIEAYRAIFNVNEDGYMWYRNAYSSDNSTWPRKLHRMYRGCSDSNGSDCSGYTGVCKTTDNFARPLEFNFAYDVYNAPINSGGLGIVATNYIDMFTAFTFHGGSGSGMAAVPGMNTLHGESVKGYGLYMKSLFTADSVEKRRATCEGCDEKSSYPIGGTKGSSDASLETTEWTYIGFHDDARIHTNNQKSLIEAPVVEFFGHAQLDTETERGTKTRLTVKADSLIFHDSAIFEGSALELIPYTTGTPRTSDMRYGVINDKGNSTKFYNFYGPAITMPDRETPVLELGYQRCNEPNNTPFTAPNLRSQKGLESAPKVGGDIIVSFKHGFSLPIYNSVVANHARISFISDSIDQTPGGEYVDTYIRTDLLRIRNKVEFYTDPSQPMYRKGVLKMTSEEQMPTVKETGIYPRHLHLEPGSELSIPGEDSLIVIATTAVGGFGNLHEDVFVKANGVIAPGFASLMEGDCQTAYTQGKMTIHNLTMEKDAVFRISIGNGNRCYDAATNTYPYCTQTDTLVVQDTIYFNETIPLVVLPETETLDPGCYLFLIYGDSLEGRTSPEYVKNLKLVEDRYGDYFFALDFSERGKVYLCVTTHKIQDVRRYVDIPQVEGVITNPIVGRYYVYGHQDFTFTASFSGSPLKVKALGYYSGAERDLDLTADWVREGTYSYTIYQVVEPWQVVIGPEPSTVSNDGIHNRRIWAHKNTLYVNADREEVVSIYNMTGVLYKRVEIPEGLEKFTLERGVYVVTLKDGSVHKIVIK